MRKIIYLILTILVLGIVAYYALLYKNSSFRKNETRFRLKDPETITEIQIISATDTSILLKSPKYWKIDEEPANPEKINNLLILASQMEAIAPVPLTGKNNVVDAMENGIEIRYKNHWKNSLSYSLFRMDGQIYARIKNSRNAYRIRVKGYPNIDLLKLFNPSKSNWKSNIIIDFHPEDISMIKLSYPGHPSEGFQITIRYDEKKIIISDAKDNAIENVNNELIYEYLYYFRNIHQIPMTNSEIPDKSISVGKSPFFLLMLSGLAGDTLELAGYRKSEKGTGQPDRNYFYGITPGNNPIILKYSDFDAILVPLDYFRKK
jgi:hypothetical protein